MTRREPRRRWPRVVATLAVIALAAVYLLRRGVTLEPRHSLRAPTATLSEELANEADVVLAPPREAPEAIDAALSLTGRSLRFGMWHRSSTRFAVEAREGHCVEYANLFGALVQRWATTHAVPVRAWVVRSRARLWGRRVPLPGWSDHDWVLVTHRDGRRWMIDPTFSDLWLGEDLTLAVREPPRAPR